MNAQTNKQDGAAFGELQVAMLLEAPEGWNRTVLDVSAAAETVAFVQRFELADGTAVGRTDLADVEAGDRLRLAIHGVRADMYREGVGTWYTATFSLAADGDFTDDFDYDHPPFDGVVDPFLLRADHEMFPRDAAHLPPWHVASGHRRWRERLVPEPPPSISLDRQAPTPTDAQLSSIADVMTAPVEDLDWSRLVLMVTGAGDGLAMKLTVEHADGTWSRQWTPVRVEYRDTDKIRKVRHDMARPGRGTWYNATFTLDRGTEKPRAELDYDGPPFHAGWDSTGQAWPVDDLLGEDQKQFPRDDEHLPAWHPARGETRAPLPPVLASHSEEPLDHRPENWIKQFLLKRATKVDEYDPLNKRAPWRKVTLNVSAAGSSIEAQVTVERPDGQVDTPRAFSLALDARVSELRRATYVKGRGAWYNATFTIEHDDGEMRAEYDYDLPPAHVTDLSSSTYLLRDHEMFPREQDHLPEWHPQSTNPPPVLRLDGPRPETDDPLLKLGYAVVDRMPVSDDWWSRIVLRISAAADIFRTSVLVTFEQDDAPYERHLYLPGLEDACLELRRSMYDHSRGAWYSAIITIDRPRLNMGRWYDYESPPFAGLWGPQEWELIQRDHELYPRDPDELPDWHPAYAPPE